MADLSITPASVVPVAGATIVTGYAGATITAGKAVYFDTADSLWKLADSNGGATNIRTPEGIALNGASAGQPMHILKLGDLTIGATMVAGVAYFLSDTPGGICPQADLAAGEYPSFLGIAKSTTVLNVNPTVSGVSL